MHFVRRLSYAAALVLCSIGAGSAIAATASAAVGEGGATAAQQQRGYKVYLEGLHCAGTEDVVGADEAYILANGVRVWAASMNDNEYKPINRTVDGFGTTTIELYDEDAGGADDDDLLGTLPITERQIGQGRQSARFTMDGANYTLYYWVQ